MVMEAENKLKQANIFRWEMWGILFIVLLGSLLHFTFELSGGWRPLGIISAVNESVWEHLKLAFWPALFWTIIEWLCLRRPKTDTRPNFLIVKAVGAYTMPALIVVIFYSYTAFTGESILAVDLSSFVIAIVIGQFVSYRLWYFWNSVHSFNWLGLSMIMLGILLFAIFTFYPPHVGLFQDSPTGNYGIFSR
jgi:Family of unknown function (DUF6512)